MRIISGLNKGKIVLRLHEEPNEPKPCPKSTDTEINKFELYLQTADSVIVVFNSLRLNETNIKFLNFV